VKFGESLSFGFRVHPVKLLDALLHRCFDTVHHVERARLQFRQKTFSDISLPKSFVEIAVGVGNATLPARLLLGRPAKVLAIKLKILIDKFG